MVRGLKWLFAGGLCVVVLCIVLGGAIWVATRGDYAVPALVTEDRTLPAAEIAGHRLHLRIIAGPEGADTVIVLHGGPGGDFRSLEALASLSDTHRVVFYDQRGAGLSERVAADALTLDGYIEELDAIIDHVAPSQKVRLIGHSWGAMLAAAYLGQAPARIDRVVLIEPGYLDASGRELWRLRARRFLSGPGYLAALIAAPFRAAHVDGPDADAARDFLIGRMVHAFANHPDNPYHCGAGYRAPMRRFGALASEVWDTAAAAEVDRIAKGAEAYAGPVLLIAGACDDWLGEALQAGHQERFRHARLSVIPDAGHDVIWDNPDAALAEIGSFLGSLSTSSPGQRERN